MFHNPNDPLIEIWGPLKQEFLNTAEPYALAYLNGGYPVFPNHLKDIQNEQREAKASHQYVAETLQPPTVPPQFDYLNKCNYFFADKIDAFKQIENELLLKVYIDANGKWNKEKRYLVAFIHIMYSLKYMRPKIKGKSEKNTRLEYRRFFEKRYKTALTQEMKPSKFPLNKLMLYKFDFNFIPEIENL